MALTEEQLAPQGIGGPDGEVPTIQKVLDRNPPAELLKSTAQNKNGYYGSLADKDPYYIPRGDQLAFTPRKIRVITVGAGFSGLLMAHKFQHRFPEMDAIVDHTIFEKRSDVGGTWIANTYPGVQCDVPSHIYVSIDSCRPDAAKRERRTGQRAHSNFELGFPFRSESRMDSVLLERRRDRAIYHKDYQKVEPRSRHPVQY
jgi:hypothetical protein